LRFAGERYPEVCKKMEASIETFLTALPGRRFVASAWYDLEIFTTLIDTLIANAAVPYEPLGVEWGRHVLNRDMNSIYRVFMKMTPPHMLFRLYSRIWSLYHDSGRFVVLSEDEHTSSFLLYGLASPRLYLPFYGSIGGAVEVLQLCGTKSEYKVLAGGKPGDRFIEFSLHWG
jgi:hypothetical protein